MSIFISIRPVLSCCCHFFNALSLRMWANKFICVLFHRFGRSFAEFLITLQLWFNLCLFNSVFASLCLYSSRSFLLLSLLKCFIPENVIEQIYLCSLDSFQQLSLRIFYYFATLIQLFSSLFSLCLSLSLSPSSFYYFFISFNPDNVMVQVYLPFLYSFKQLLLIILNLFATLIQSLTS